MTVRKAFQKISLDYGRRESGIQDLRMKRYGLSAMRWKAEFLKVKHTEDLEKDVVRQSIKHLPRFLSRISRRAADRWLICLKENQPKHGKNERESTCSWRGCSYKTSGADDHDAYCRYGNCHDSCFMSFYGET